jgi:hypothetical protein
MTLYASTRCSAAALLIATVAIVMAVMSGCAVDKSATPDAEMSAAVKSRDDARAIQAESQTRAKDANAVLDGK